LGYNPLPMIAFLNLGPGEVLLVAVVAVLVFGRRLPEVAGQAAGMVQRMRRSLAELRRETGIDQEILAARRSIEQSMPRDLESFDVPSIARREAAEIRKEARAAVDPAQAAEPEPPARTPDRDPPDGATRPADGG
jgi:Sec-independent protein translocase protein TatA